MSETWYEIMKRELARYDEDWAENEELLNAICEICEDNQ